MENVPKKETGFRGISIKKELIDDVENTVNKHPELGYKNIADFVQEATRIRIQEVKKQIYEFSSKKKQ